ncbi:hypothetical protein MMC10_001632 [Thelotrema lepadinum]|nr:hypothetical protein [Thelotrema lepadinum]
MAADSSTVAAICIAVIMQLLAIGAVTLREYSRRTKKQDIGADQWVLFAALVVSLGIAITTAIAAANGMLGVSLKVEVLSTSLTEALSLVFANMALYLAAVTLIRVSIILSYRRIFPVRRLKWPSVVILGLTVAWFLTFFIAIMVLAATEIPSSSNQTRPPIPTSFGYQGPIETAVAISDIILDLCVLCLPIPVIKSLQMETRRKLAVIGFFWLGAFCVIASVVRLWYVLKSFGMTNGIDIDDGATIANLFIWSHIEPCASIVAACLPTLSPLLANEKVRAILCLPIRRARSTYEHRTRATTNQQATTRASDGWTRLETKGSTPSEAQKLPLEQINPIAKQAPRRL